MLIERLIVTALRDSSPYKLKLVSDMLTICDVRVGPTEDKHMVPLDSGIYSVGIDNDDESVAITICKPDVVQAEPGKEIGEISIDGAVIGAYDAELFSKVFDADAEAFYDWGEGAFDVAESIRIFRESIEPYEFACIPTQLDGVFRIIQLTENGRTVGVRLSALLPASEASDMFVAFQFHLAAASTRIEVWLDPVYDDESILDSIVDELEEFAVDKFIADIESVELAVQVDEELLPGQDVDLSKLPATWKSDRKNFCESLRRIMVAHKIT